MRDTRTMSPAEALIDALEQVATRHEERSYGVWSSYHEPTVDERAQDMADKRIAEALRDVASEFAAALGIER